MWRVKYNPLFDTWHEKSSPTIVDQDGNIVVEMFQNSNHPGIYDEKSDKLAHLIVNAVNEFRGYYVIEECCKDGLYKEGYRYIIKWSSNSDGYLIASENGEAVKFINKEDAQAWVDKKNKEHFASMV